MTRLRMSVYAVLGVALFSGICWEPRIGERSPPKPVSTPSTWINPAWNLNPRALDANPAGSVDAEKTAGTGKTYIPPGPCPPGAIGQGHVIVNGVDMGCSITAEHWVSTPDDPRPHTP